MKDDKQLPRWKMLAMISETELVRTLVDLEQEGYEIKNVFPTGSWFTVLARLILKEKKS